jgi:transcription initiation factor TFIID TATA-box-binding protein
MKGKDRLSKAELSLHKPLVERMRAEIKICNVVASVDFRQRLPLSAVKKAFPTVSGPRSRFPGVVVKLDRPKTANLIFSTGKMICTGSSSEYGARTAVKKLVLSLRRRGVKLREKPKVRIQNVVALVNFKRNINLERVAKTLTGTIYEPEQFPGLIYQMENPKTVALLFSNGKAVLTGARNRAEVEAAVKRLEKSLFMLKKKLGKVEVKASRVEDVNVGDKALKLLEVTYSLCEFCSYNCDSCPYPGLGVYLEKLETPIIEVLSAFSRVERCERGFYIKPKREVAIYLKLSKERLAEALTGLFTGLTPASPA